MIKLRGFLGKGVFMTEQNFKNNDSKTIIANAKTIAIVGISSDESKPSYRVAQYLKEHGYTIIPVNPRYDEILGEKCYKELALIPVHVDIVDIFRKAEFVEDIVLDSINIKADTVWMQLGIVNEKAADIALQAGLNVVMDKCTKIEHSLM